MLRGYSGYNTRWALKVLEKVFPATDKSESESPLAVTVFFGANDASLPDNYSAFQHVPIDEYKHNLHFIVSFLKVLLFLVWEFFLSQLIDGFNLLVQIWFSILKFIKILVKLPTSQRDCPSLSTYIIDHQYGLLFFSTPYVHTSMHLVCR